MNYRTMRPDLAESIAGPIAREPEFLELEEVLARRPIDSDRVDVLMDALCRKGFSDRDVTSAFSSGPYRFAGDRALPF